MTKESEIVRALRHTCDGCNPTPCCEFEALGPEAADLIESLQAQLLQKTQELTDYTATGLTPGDVKDLQALCKENGLAKYVDLIVEAKRQMGKSNEQSIEQGERIDQLEAQLAASQRRERAAVEDMKLIVDAVREAHCDETCCFACKFDCDTSITDSGCYANECPGFDTNECFEWRGVKEERE